MGIEHKEVKVYRASYICDECGNSDMKYTGFSQPAFPPTYHHVCPSCRDSKYLDKVYPAIVYKEIE